MSPEPEIFTPFELACIAIHDPGALAPAAIAERLLDRAGDRLSPMDCGLLADALQGWENESELRDLLRRAGYPVPTPQEGHHTCLIHYAEQVVDGRATPREGGGVMVWHAARMDDDRYYWMLDLVIDQEGDALRFRGDKPEEQVLAEFWEWATPLVRDACAVIVSEGRARS